MSTRIQPPPDPALRDAIRAAMDKQDVPKLNSPGGSAGREQRLRLPLRQREISTRTLVRMLDALGLEIAVKKKKKEA